MPADNARTFNDPRVVAVYSATGWLDPGEERSIRRVARECRGGRIVDLGVGTGRTTGLLTLLSDDYVGLDYAPRMLAKARERFPGVDLRDGDARRLDGIPDHSARLIMFSYNGIDAVAHEDRAGVLAEIVRVLEPGGYAVLSSLNLHGRSARPRFHRLLSRDEGLLTPIRRARRLGRSALNYRRAQSHVRRGDGWAHLPLDAHECGVLAHFSTLSRLREEWATAGLTVVAIYTDRGRDVTADEDSDADYFHYVLRAA
ncbi:methyltransferase domain-containing protein [Calidifontibacter sp. DB0510]|uniref:Methyltransferase domain-containing protein n=1 Tax=Metallococcus carri TaxID=1656884 RepID=A0A967EAV1_9MICO|nr:class I SAM-dependent methyltransferase [Metallococcus carri]NHN56625.1 methyltransferase domain-containing protein [Metallococcus carri]NOP38924.1 methyltransferase domain-containing protein [Calidifontibacter sp. DB2511S]